MITDSYDDKSPAKINVKKSENFDIALALAEYVVKLK